MVTGSLSIEGQRLFPNGLDSMMLLSEDVTSYGKGIIVLAYAPA